MRPVMHTESPGAIPAQPGARHGTPRHATARHSTAQHSTERPPRLLGGRDRLSSLPCRRACMLHGRHGRHVGEPVQLLHRPGQGQSAPGALLLAHEPQVRPLGAAGEHLLFYQPGPRCTECSKPRAHRCRGRRMDTSHEPHARAPAPPAQHHPFLAPCCSSRASSAAARSTGSCPGPRRP
jgi:hypothetical protein